MVWFCGGHGTCDIPNPPAEQDARGLIDNLKWLDQYVAGDPDNPAEDIANFQWYDQYGLHHVSDLLPFQAGFNEATPYTTSGGGGVLGIVPFLGGSGPHPLKDLPFSIANAGPAINAVNLTVTPPVGSEIVGAPTVSFSYTGLGAQPHGLRPISGQHNGIGARQQCHTDPDHPRRPDARHQHGHRGHRLHRARRRLLDAAADQFGGQLPRKPLHLVWSTSPT